MSDHAEIVARAIAKVIITKSLATAKMEGLAKIIAINEGVESVWPDLLDEANAALDSMKVRLDG